MSSASMLLETSSANTTSTPSLFTVFNLTPIFGLTSDRIRNEIPMIKKMSFNVDLKAELSGAGLRRSVMLENFRCVLFFHHHTKGK